MVIINAYAPTMKAKSQPEPELTEAFYQDLEKASKTTSYKYKKEKRGAMFTLILV